MIGFKISGNDYYYIALTVNLFKDIICDWLGDVLDCYVLFSQSLHEHFKHFEISSSLEVLYKSNVKFGSFHKDQLASGLPESTSLFNCNYIGAFSLNDSKRSDQNVQYTSVR